MSWLDFLPEITLPESLDIDIVHVGDTVEGDQVQGDVVAGDDVDSEYAIVTEGDTIPVDDVERVIPGKLSGDAPLEVQAGGRELVIDPQNLEPNDEWEDVVKPGLRAGWEVERSVSMRSAYPILLQAERNVTDEKIAEIVGFFSGMILTNDLLLLKSSLTIDRAMNADGATGMADDELKRRKRQLAEKYHEAAFSLPSLCSSGYFDEGKLFRHVYERMDELDEFDVDDYDTVFRRLITHKPFVAYVQNSQPVEELEDIVRGKLNRLSQYDVPLPYVDVRGIGRSNHQKIRAVMDTLDAEFSDLEYDERLGDGELIARIEADSIR